MNTVKWDGRTSFPVKLNALTLSLMRFQVENLNRQLTQRCELWESIAGKESKLLQQLNITKSSLQEAERKFKQAQSEVHSDCIFWLVFSVMMERRKGNVLINDALDTFRVIWHRTYGKGPFG